MLKYIYLALAITGLAVTWYYNLLFMGQGHDLMDFIKAPAASFATQSLAFDLLIATATGSILMVVEGRRCGIRHAWLYIILSFAIAFAFAFPLFLFHREWKKSRDLLARSK